MDQQDALVMVIKTAMTMIFGDWLGYNTIEYTVLCLITKTQNS